MQFELYTLNNDYFFGVFGIQLKILECTLIEKQTELITIFLQKYISNTNKIKNSFIVT